MNPARRLEALEVRAVVRWVPPGDGKDGDAR